MLYEYALGLFNARKVLFKTCLRLSCPPLDPRGFLTEYTTKSSRPNLQASRAAIDEQHASLEERCEQHTDMPFSGYEALLLVEVEVTRKEGTRLIDLSFSATLSSQLLDCFRDLWNWLHDGKVPTLSFLLLASRYGPWVYMILNF